VRFVPMKLSDEVESLTLSILERRNDALCEAAPLPMVCPVLKLFLSERAWRQIYGPFAFGDCPTFVDRKLPGVSFYFRWVETKT
jgi:hypothetical protein